MTKKEMFKDKMSRYITRGLFIETTTDIGTALYTLTDEDVEINGVKYESLKKFFMLLRDPNGYEFALKFFYNYEHYKRLQGFVEFRKAHANWLEELELSLQAEGISLMVMHAKAPTGTSAARWLASCGWKGKARAGRPSKAQVAAALDKETEARTETEQDFDRVMTPTSH